MKLITQMITMLAGCAVLATGHTQEFEDYARVLNVTPQIEQVNQPRQQCWIEQAPVMQPSPHRGVGGAIVGGVAGGLLGSQIGRGSGRTAAAAVGAVTGALVGDRLENQQQYSAYNQPVQRCQMVDHWVTRNNGYAVTYEYRGHTQITILPYEPGSRIPVHVSVTPRF